MERVTHFEIQSDDPENSIHFYKNVFNREFNRWGNQEYWLAITGEEGTPGINGAIMKKRDPAQPIVNSIEVEDIQKTEEKIKSNGGKIVVPKMAIPGVDWLIYFKDPDGNIFGAMQENSGAK